MNPIQITLGNEVFSVVVWLSEYLNGGTGMDLVDAEDGSPFARISVNLPETAGLEYGEFYVKHWSENADVVAQLIEQGIIAPVPGRYVASTQHVDGIKAYRWTGKAG